MSVTVTTDLARAFNERMVGLINKSVLVGIPGDKGRRKKGRRKKSDGVNNAELGYIHENGSPANKIPARPFLVPGVDQVKDSIALKLAKASVDLTSESSVNIAMNNAGLAAQQSVKNRIRNSVDMKGLSEATKQARRTRKSGKRTGVMKPLIDTGQLLNSITYVITE